jgi:Uma2 family endonuclease
MATGYVETTELMELHSGDRMTRAEFHRIYEQMPEDFRAELIGGTVYVSSPLKRRHGTRHSFLDALLAAYEGSTPGVECGNNTTILLGEEGEPQPDAYLRILPEYGGQSGTTDDDYVDGPPELVVEIANSSRAIDLYGKKDDYTLYGVQEYLVLCLRESELKWFDLAGRKETPIDLDGVVRTRSFPGLWIHVEALLARNYTQLMQTLEAGLATQEHAEFVKRLVGQQRPTST